MAFGQERRNRVMEETKKLNINDSSIPNASIYEGQKNNPW